MNKCLYCQCPTENLKFCSQTCVYESRRKKNYCKYCKTEIPVRKRCCTSCNPQLVDWTKVTYAEAKGMRKYQKNSRIRDLARIVYNKSDRPKKCFVCEYDKHIEICHIKAISSHADSDTISKINSLNNLVALCPNHHWEFDNGHLSLDFSFLAT